MIRYHRTILRRPDTLFQTFLTDSPQKISIDIINYHHSLHSPNLPIHHC